MEPHRMLQTAGDFRQYYVGKHITQLPKPALILDKAKMYRHCQSLLDAVEYLGVDFRAHVKTHKVHKIILPMLPTPDTNFRPTDSRGGPSASWRG